LTTKICEEFLFFNFLCVYDLKLQSKFWSDQVLFTEAGMHCMPCIHWRYAPGLSSFAAFAESTYTKPFTVKSNIVIIVNCRQLSVTWTWTIHNYFYGALISLCGLNLTFKSLVWMVYTLCTSEMPFLFINCLIPLLPNIYFVEHFLQTNHTSGIINSQNIISDEMFQAVWSRPVSWQQLWHNLLKLIFKQYKTDQMNYESSPQKIQFCTLSLWSQNQT